MGRRLLALGLAALVCLALAARAAGLPIAPSRTIHGQPTSSDAAQPLPSPQVVVPRLDPGPAAFARSSAQAAELEGTSSDTTEPGGAATSGAESNAGLATAVFGSLNAAGLSAKAQTEATGASYTPPDTTGAIGPSHYVEFVNSEVAAYKRADLGIVGSPVVLSTFTGGTGVCDPQIKYDPQTERWFYVAIRCDGTPTENAIYLGFSKTSDPTNFSTGGGGGWCGYSYGFGGAVEDYPKLGLDALHIIIGTNSFNPTTLEFLTAHIFAGPKPASGKIVTCPTAPALTTFGSSGIPLKTSVESHTAFTPEPATVADSSPSGYVVAADWAAFASGAHVMIWQVTGTAEAPTLTSIGAPAVSAFSEPPDIPQPSSTDQIDSSDTRLTQAVAAADPNIAGSPETVWTQHTVAGGAGSVVRWYELVPSKVEAHQVGTISDASKYVFNGAIAPTLAGGAILDYNTGSGSAMVNIMAQSRVGSDPLGTMNGPITLASSSAVDSEFECPSQPKGKERGRSDCRWGDYAGASVDPTNAEVVWGSNQVNGPTGALITGVGHLAQWVTQNFALTTKAPAPPAPHWYSDGVVIAEGTPEIVKTSGTLTLHALSGGLVVTCKVKDQETIENPAGGGAGVDKVTAFTLSGCKAPGACSKGEKLEVHASAPGSTKLLVGPPIRDEVPGVEFRIVCKKSGEKVLDILTGTLTPEVGNSVLAFGAGSGELKESGGAGKATVSGTDKLKGPKKDAIITAKTP